MEERKTHRISPHMTGRAGKLRREMTVPERLLWTKLRSRGVNGLKFRRQHVVGPYVADSYCPEARLAVEVDGQSHDDLAADDRRTAYLESQGVNVVRVTNDEVLGQRLAVLDGILAAAESRLTELDPHPNPLPSRERE